MQTLLEQGYQNHKLRKTFLNFSPDTMIRYLKFYVGFESLLRQGISGDLVYKLKKIVEN